MQKFIFIGLGGSGGKTLAYLHRSLSRRLQAREWTAGIPSVWQFLHIDPREDSDALGGDIPQLHAGAIEYLPLAYAGESYASYDRKLSSVPPLFDGISGWRPEPPESIPPPYLGAGQRRSVGRVLTLANLSAIQQALQGMVQRVSGQEAEAELTRLKAALGASPNLADATHAVVVGSLAGGSGSGALIDIVQLVRGFSPQGWAENPLVVAYTPDCFDDLPLDMRLGINGNALAALCELIAAAEGSHDERGDALLAQGSAYVPTNGGNRIGKMTALIGRSSENFSLSSVNDVYRTVGNALAGSLTNEATLEDLSSFIVNTNGSSYANGYRVSRYAVPEISAPVFANACGSFGYASVGLGRHLFTQYAAERIAKLAIRRLREGHLEFADPGEAITSERLIERVVEARWEPFFEASGIYEAGLEHNQVLDALRDKTELGGMLDGMRDRVLAHLRRDDLNLEPAEARDAFGSAFSAEQELLMREADRLRHERALAWVPEVQAKLIRETAREIARSGFPVALELLQRLGVQVDEAVEDLRVLRDQFETEERGLVNAVNGVFAPLLQLKERITFRHERIADAAQHRRDATQRRVEIELFRIAETLLADISKNMLPQLRASVALASRNLESQTTDRGLAQRRYEQWSDGPLPRHLTPAPNEFLLEPAAQFPHQLERLLGATYDLPPGEALSRAVEEVITGMWPDTTNPGSTSQTLVTTRSSWRPGEVSARAADVGAGPGSFEVTTDINRLRDNAEEWMRRRNDLAQYVGETLRDYLRPGGQLLVDRAARFEEGLRSALAASAPLVRIDKNVDSMIHHTPFEASPTITKLPVAPTPGDELFERVKQALLDAGLKDEQIRSWCDPSADVSECEIVRFAKTTKHPIVFESLTEPIAQEWAVRSTTPQERAVFWQLRRSRPLMEFIPLGIELQVALVRGWYTANLLNQIERDDHGLVAVWTRHALRAFPNPLLSGVELDPRQLLPKLLESYPLALLELTVGRPQSLEAYERLIDLGCSGEQVDGRPRLDSYTAVNAELAGWVRNGSIPDGAPTPLSDVAGEAGEDASQDQTLAEARRETVAGRLKQAIDEYAAIASPSLQGTRTVIDRRWEIRPVVDAALRPMVHALETMVIKPNGRGVF